MEVLLKSVEPALESGWDSFSAKRQLTVDPEDQASVVAEVVEIMAVPEIAKNMPYQFQDTVWSQLLPSHKRRAVALLAWAAHVGGSACCDLDAGPVYSAAALPATTGPKMFIAVGGGAADGVVVKILSPYHLLAVRGYAQPGRINLSTLADACAQRAAEAAVPAMAATACILAVMRAKTVKTNVNSGAQCAPKISVNSDGQHASEGSGQHA